MIIDATDRLAKRVAVWILNAGMTPDQVRERLHRFPEEFIKQVGAHVRQIKGLPKRS